MKKDPNGESYSQQVANGIIEQLERGTAPWLRPWKPGERYLPYNAITGKDYKGINSLWLSIEGDSKGYGDHRWLTYRQAAGAGAQVRRGETGSRVEFWQWTDERPLLNDAGKPLLDDKGKPITQTVRLERPIVRVATVFNAEQVDGLPPPEKRLLAPEHERHEEAERLLLAGGTIINHAAGDRAFYSPTNDRITMPFREQFISADAYYATALHEKGHWTGHESRLNRDLSHPFGSEAYAREELRAEIASLMLGDRLGIGHDPGHHAAYVASWIKALRADPREIFRASADAERITGYVLDLGKEQIQEQTQTQPQTQPNSPTLDESIEVKMPAIQKRPIAKETDDPKGRTYLAVPYAEKDAARLLGAKWDRAASSWYAPAGVDMAALSKWMPAQQQKQSAGIDPRVEFGDALRAAGLLLKELPVMDGRIYRVPVEGDKGTAKSGAYKGHLDGRPAGFIENFRTGEKTTWTTAQATAITIDRAAAAAQSVINRAERDKEMDAQYKTAALAAAAAWSAAKPAGAHPYLAGKGVESHELRVDEKGNLLVPVHGPNGELWNLQKIGQQGWKGFGKGGRLAGGSYMIGDVNKDGPLLIAEGYATAATVHELTGQPVAVAFNASNLSPVAEAYRERFPDRPLIIAGDNDHHLPEQIGANGLPKPNVGAVKAREAANKVQGLLLLPHFDKAAKGTDWNDLAQEKGRDHVQGVLHDGLVLSHAYHLGRDQEMAQIAQSQEIETSLSHDAEASREQELMREQVEELGFDL